MNISFIAAEFIVEHCLEPGRLAENCLLSTILLSLQRVEELHALGGVEV
jgi:hypothetical protein